MKKILITGASGFIGSFMVEEALRRGYETWVAVRRSSSLAYLQDERIHLIELDFSEPERLQQQLRECSFDYVIHAAGVTKCLHQSDFYKVNTEGTISLVKALVAMKMPLKRFVYLSSLSVFGPIREQQPYTAIEPTDNPMPNTAYGKSKLEAEKFLDTVADQINFVILRPTGVYGPREKDYFLMAKSIRQHVDFSVGYKPQDITFVYVDDVVRASFLALEQGKNGGKYFLSDGSVYRSTDFSRLLHLEMGRPWLLRIKAPVVLLRVVTFLGEYVGRLTRQVSALNNDKYHILKQRNWRCNIQPAIDELGYQPQVNLEQGVRKTVAWYKANGWL